MASNTTPSSASAATMAHTAGTWGAGAMRDPEGQVVRWIGSNTDIEEQKATAPALAKRTPRWRSKFARRLQSATASALSSDIMLVADFNGILTAVNPACTTTLGWRQRDVTDTSFLYLVHPDDVQSTVQQTGSLKDGGHVLPFWMDDGVNGADFCRAPSRAGRRHCSRVESARGTAFLLCFMKSSGPPTTPSADRHALPPPEISMSFDNFLSRLKSKAGELKTEALKYKNKDFLNAAMAGSALVAMADGSVSAEEKQKMIKFIESHDALSIFTTSDVIKAFQEHVSQLEFDKDIGQAKAFQALGKMKSNVEASRLLVRMIIAIASSDGDFDASERAVAVRITKELALNPAEFELQ